MQLYDVIMLVVILGAALLGFRKGLAWQVASLASIFLSYVVAVQFRDLLAPMFSSVEPWNKFLAMLLLYLGTSLLIWIAFQLVSGFLDRAKLKEFDRQLGAIFGATKGALLCVIITLFAVSLLEERQRQQIIYSHSGHYIAQLLHRSEGVIPNELHELLEPYLHQLDERVEGPAPTASLEPTEAARPVELQPADESWELPRHAPSSDLSLTPAPEEDRWRAMSDAQQRR